jgi:hypothetical protein
MSYDIVLWVRPQALGARASHRPSELFAHACVAQALRRFSSLIRCR